MGAVVSRWRAKPSTVEVLEALDKDIQALEENREKTQKQRKLWVYRLLLYSVLLYMIACTVVYVWYIPEQTIGKVIVASPFLIFPLVVWLLRKLLIVLYNRRTERNNEKLEDLKAEKKKILEQVMETETYKNAKLILERFDPDSKKKLELEAQATGPPATPRPGQELRQRLVSPRPAGRPPPVPGSAPPTPLSAPGGPPEKGLSTSTPHGLIRRPGTPAGTPAHGMGMHPPGPPLARPILPRDRGAMDRVVEYLVGDGPQNRYALICQQCLSHNGMALKEEFEYIAFRCAYCYFLNPARKTRPQAPRLPEFTAEAKMSQDPPAVAMETDLSSAPPAPEGKAGHVNAEAGEQTSDESPSEEKKPADPDPHTHTHLPDEAQAELDVSAMEVE
ncbi:endoplasmic reticulum junction formation protein lunapark-A [Pimephales promelas]|uniref:endoplasmic reticulum junction formation protein lunapark-A n=1 Tax=Pimephales promelas TaxID=90988 RepID=UPI0019555E34|nr:endoplasmic reticulum junction formation protein lunapark-A [Pimephales promelas]KAG1938895.1 endoplasmic reticulum junction formation protein lunapark [Pimephales promelas]